MVAQAPQSPQHVGDVASEHAAQHVEFVDDHVCEVGEEPGPLVVAGEDPGVEHLGVGEHHVGVRPDPPAFRRGAVTVVGGGHHPVEPGGGHGGELVACECLGGEHQQRGRLRPLGAEGVENGCLVTQRLSGCRAGGDHHGLAGAYAVDRLGLMGPQGADPECVKDAVGERWFSHPVPSGGGGAVGHVDHPGVVTERVGEGAQRRVGPGGQRKVSGGVGHG